MTKRETWVDDYAGVNCDDDIEFTPKPAPAPKYSVGQRVTLLADIWDDGQDHHPAGYLAQRGEVLIVRKIDTGHEFPYCVSHEHITDRSFRVAESEIEG